MRRLLGPSPTLAAVVALLYASPAASAETRPIVTAQPDASADPAPYVSDPAADPQLSPAQMTSLLQRKIKYVFVIFNENHSFDNEYGTFPGVNGLYSDGRKPRAAADTPGFEQTYTDVDGHQVTVRPFLIGPEQNSSVVDSVDHSHVGLAAKLHVVDGEARMDRFAEREYGRFAALGGAANLAKGTQFARLVMSHIDCDTIPFFWNWAKNFTVFDNIFATEDTPSTPNAIAMIAGQSGETQWVKHPHEGPINPAYGTIGPLVSNGANAGKLIGPPFWGDSQPFYGSPLDPTVSDRATTCLVDHCTTHNISEVFTFASLPLTFQGRNVASVMAGNRNPALDLADIQRDIPYIRSLNGNPVNWRWYQEGYGVESSDGGAAASHAGYVTHHNAAQFFGYVANTPALLANLKSESDFFTDVANNRLPNGGVFYIRGGYNNQNKLLPPITRPDMPEAEVAAIRATKAGDDDHPAYTDRQISEAMAASVINAIAGSPALWSQSAIVITYDESDGFYDHVPPRILSYGPDGLPLARGLRVPLILISPFARSHAVSHVEGDHNAVIQTINTIFGLPPLASLPDEAEALAAGNAPEFNRFGPPGFEQKHLGPRDLNSPITESLLSGFDPKRLLGMSPPLPASLAQISPAVVTDLPHFGGQGCRAVGITPTDRGQGIVNPLPAGFNPLPSTYPAANRGGS